METKNIEIGDWVLFPKTKDDRDNPDIVAKVLDVKENVVYVSIQNQPLPVPKNYCRVVYVQQV